MTVGRLACSVAKEKLIDYLLNVHHPVGGSKARFFLGMGFTLDRWDIMADALRDHPARNAIVKSETSPFGLVHVVRCCLETPNGRDPCVATIRQETGEGPDIVRLVTAYPAS